MRERNEVTRTIREKLETCPNCGYRLTQKTSSSILCKVCGIKIYLETKNERILQWIGVVGILTFALGLCIRLILGV